MRELVVPTVRLHRAWLEARAEWGPGLHEDGFGLRAADEVESAVGFGMWVGRLRWEEDRSEEGGGRCTYRWIVEDGRVLGGIALRHRDNRYGHIGYGVRPSARRRGVATWALREMLGEARGIGLGRVLLVCEAGNAASAMTIERNGGVLEREQDTEHGVVRRYWIEL
ncbi:GNAT family N-acetyltransferase [Nocardia huaxiensis]|uniref:GNAT family N-acetyltransferase n=1 Tax=Nocardia huaxiensis TaxID=2755382 RepID=A0A7D6ZLA2_9NOCA|nr:GNAT family N-acetyltransferase [Nocardia huaxiensis]QLY30183.1 GNAT family N-acetyltransferase [Nocardia huaxiensis]UFS96202.1 GNAT family N-acetyltransferase [Nocardia huaxiensis]